MVRSSPLRTSEDESALSMSSTGSEADTLGLLRIMSKYIAFVSVPTKTLSEYF